MSWHDSKCKHMLLAAAGALAKLKYLHGWFGQQVGLCQDAVPACIVMAAAVACSSCSHETAVQDQC